MIKHIIFTQNCILISVTTTSTTRHKLILLNTPEEPKAISSPNYPGNYPNNVTFSVSFLSFREDTYIELYFLDLALAPSCQDPLIIDGGKLC